jgi:hypothetical protein
MQEAEPIAPLLSKLVRDFAKLAGQEAALAGAEMKKKAIALVIGIALLILAALLGVAILATLTATLILAFALIVAPWLAALIVTGIYALVALILALVAKAQFSRALPPIPSQTIASVKENLAWASRLIK